MYQGPNATTEFITREILGDHEWLRNSFIPESHKRLRYFRDKVIDWISEVEKATGKEIPYIRPRAGFFIFINFSNFLHSETFEAEAKLQQAFFDNKVLFVRGESLHMSKPGWFRIVFSSYDEETLNKGLKRISRALECQ
uniref:Aminotransferase class I/classII domain-containing protein n=1 Tax=Panagrolaimus sp. PS1159 TaxID=55785 RepID=A0AC35FUT2_9BILA